MSEIKTYPVPETAKQGSLISSDEYEAMYKASIETPETFWKQQSDEFIDWIAPWHTLTESDLAKVKPVGLKAASSTSAPTVSTGTYPSEPTKPRLFGKAMTLMITPISAIKSYTMKSVNSPMC